METKDIHLMCVPFTGLGMYGGFRGNKWLKNRIQVFKQFVVPSLLAQTDQDFKLWLCWRDQERNNLLVWELHDYLQRTGLDWFATFSGVPFWDDKYPDEVALKRLANTIVGASAELINRTSAPDTYIKNVLMTIQPSDDCYCKDFVEGIKEFFQDNPEAQAAGFTEGYIMNYATKEVCEYNPLTIPPFFTIKFPREVFINAASHIDYTGPYKSHEYIGTKLKFQKIEERGFLVGTHGENISTVFNHPFKGQRVEGVLEEFGLEQVEPLKIKLNIWKRWYRALPFWLQRKLRYYLGERLVNVLYQ